AGTIISTDDDGVFIDAVDGANLTNHGEISAYGIDHSSAVIIQTFDGDIDVVNTGLLSSYSQSQHAEGVYAYSVSGDISLSNGYGGVIGSTSVDSSAAGVMAVTPVGDVWVGNDG